MKSRTEAVARIKKLLENGPSSKATPDFPGKKAWHFGYCELRELMDYIYGGEPKVDSQRIGRAKRVSETERRISEFDKSAMWRKL